MTLVRYAGKDDDDLPFSEMQTDSAVRREKIFDFFSLGYDTYSIAKMVKIPEHEALKILSTERSSREFLPSPYGVQL